MSDDTQDLSRCLEDLVGAVRGVRVVFPASTVGAAAQAGLHAVGLASRPSAITVSEDPLRVTASVGVVGERPAGDTAAQVAEVIVAACLERGLPRPEVAVTVAQVQG